MEKSRFTDPVRVERYLVRDTFWSEKMELVRTKMLPYQWRVLNDAQPGVRPSRCIRNFRIAAGLEAGKFEGFVFQDSDLAKWLEAVGYTLAWHPDAALEALADGAIDLICRAQQPDGYMDTYYIINGLDKAWTNLADHHELYCAGHMIEAAVAYYEGTGKRKLLDAVIRLADCIDAKFGAEDGKKRGYPGHEILELALMRLFAVTNEPRYAKLAAYFIDERGRQPGYFPAEREQNGTPDPWKNSLFHYAYYQADRPVREQETAEGHAVRAVYLYSGMAAAAKATGDESLFRACRRLWEDVTCRQMYITGAIGASPYGESFTFDYDLPNDTIYGETCAAIGLTFWARRMLETEIDRSYAEVMERCLYNGILSGTNTEGNAFFYVNPLEVVPESSEKDEAKRHVLTQREAWFDCACCPPNLARMLASVGGYACTERKGLLAFHLYLGGEITSAATGLRLREESALPWSGDVKLEILQGSAEAVTLLLRVPTWCRGGFGVKVNGVPAEAEISGNGYAAVTRVFASGDRVELKMEMPVRVQRADPRVRADFGKLCVTRGPLVYCLEEADMGKHLHLVLLGKNAEFAAVPGRVQAGTLDLEADGARLREAWGDALYSDAAEPEYEACRVHLIPYYLWCNRGKGEMTVWIHEYRP